MSTVWPSLLYSLAVALPATALAAVVGIPVAYLAARRRFPGKWILEAAVLVPLLLPPTVVGYVLVLLFGRRGLIGEPIAGATGGYSILFRPEGGMLAAAVVALPLLYLPGKAAFASVEREMEETARLNGANGWHVFWLVSLPIAWRGVASGLVLGFARALGEFGATVMVMGNQTGKPMTLPVLVYNRWEQGEFSEAAGPVIILSAIAILLAVLFNRLPRE